VRKVLGASVMSITRLLSLDFIKLVGMGILIAYPVSYYFMNKWLADFAYRSKINWWVFALGAFIAVGITIFTISFHSIKAAMANPVKSIKTE
jgi:putative ABC transport system permease protein